MSAPQLTEATIRQYASGESLRRGKSYYEQGAVLSLAHRGKTMEAEVRGSSPRPYIVRCRFDEQGAPHASCTCPYDWGGWCKHIVAACLTMINRPDKMEERPALETLLAALDREQLQALLLKLAEHDPSLPDVIEGLLVRTTIATKGRPIPLDAAKVRRQIQEAFRGREYEDYNEYDDYWNDEEATVEIFSELDGLLERIRAMIGEGEGYSVLPPLQTFTEELLSRCEELDYDLDAQGWLLEEIGATWTEALLSTDLSEEERKFWIKRLDDWILELEVYDRGEAFEAAQDAAARGWDYPPLQHVLQGNTEQRAWEGEAPPYAKVLTDARLKILQHQGRLQEYIYLAKAEGKTEAYLNMLVRLGRVDEAMSYGLRNLKTADKAFTLAKTLDEQGAHELSLQVAEHGLSLPGVQTPLAKWLSEKAVTAGKQGLALRAAKQVFQDEITLANYLKVGVLAGERREQECEAMRAYVRDKGQGDGAIDIFLHEQLIDDAIAAVGSQTTQEMIEKVVEAAMPTRPEWAISVCRGRAETLIRQGTSHYETAAHWLAKARTGYYQLGAIEEWHDYLNELLQKNARKYKLVRALNVLR